MLLIGNVWLWLLAMACCRAQPDSRGEPRRSALLFQECDTSEQRWRAGWCILVQPLPEFLYWSQQSKITHAWVMFTGS